MKNRKLKITLAISVWLIAFISLFNCGLRMVSAPSSIENIIGFLILVLIVYFSFSTKCLTKFFKKKEEKEN